MRRSIYMLIGCGAAWMTGLAVFIAGLPRPGAPEITASEDGIIVYTGGGGRIDAAMTLFAEGDSRRLLISGVHPDTSRSRLSELWAGAQEKFDCCVDIGREARSTEGNALEAAAWSRQNNIEEITLVTSEYHMPRAITATKAKMPDVKVTAYAVSSGYLDEHGRPVSGSAWWKLAGEYTKFLLAKIRAVVSTLGA